MDSSSNRFGVFQVDSDNELDNEVEQLVSEKKENESLHASSDEKSPWKDMNIGSWADAEEEDSNDSDKTSQSKEQPGRFLNHSKVAADKKTRELDARLKTLIQIAIPYKSHVFDKESGKYQEVAKTRVLRVISQQYYEQLQRLIGGYRTHRGPNGGYVDAEKQKTKIKLANELLQCCAKDKNKKCCFLYAIAIIHTTDKEGNSKKIVRNEIQSTSRCYFECDDMTYRFTV